MGKEYSTLIENNYKGTFEKSKTTIDNEIASFINTFKSIIDGNDFPSEAEDKWNAKVNTMSQLSEELKTKIDEKYSKFLEQGEIFQKWFDDLKSLEGDPGNSDEGYNFAKKMGFEPLHDKYVHHEDLAGDYSWGIDAIYMINHEWNVYSKVYIGDDGYIKIDAKRYMLQKSYYAVLDSLYAAINVTSDVANRYMGGTDAGGYQTSCKISRQKTLKTRTLTIKSQEDYDRYFNKRGIRNLF